MDNGRALALVVPGSAGPALCSLNGNVRAHTEVVVGPAEGAEAKKVVEFAAAVRDMCHDVLRRKHGMEGW